MVTMADAATLSDGTTVEVSKAGTIMSEQDPYEGVVSFEPAVCRELVDALQLALGASQAASEGR
jgi:hypothetical protein